MDKSCKRYPPQPLMAIELLVASATCNLRRANNAQWFHLPRARFE